MFALIPVLNLVICSALGANRLASGPIESIDKPLRLVIVKDSAPLADLDEIINMKDKKSFDLLKSKDAFVMLTDKDDLILIPKQAFGIGALENRLNMMREVQKIMSGGKSELNEQNTSKTLYKALSDYMSAMNGYQAAKQQGSVKLHVIPSLKFQFTDGDKTVTHRWLPNTPDNSADYIKPREYDDVDVKGLGFDYDINKMKCLEVHFNKSIKTVKERVQFAQKATELLGQYLDNLQKQVADSRASFMSNLMAMYGEKSWNGTILNGQSGLRATDLAEPGRTEIYKDFVANFSAYGFSSEAEASTFFNKAKISVGIYANIVVRSTLNGNTTSLREINLSALN